VLAFDLLDIHRNVWHVQLRFVTDLGATTVRGKQDLGLYPEKRVLSNDASSTTISPSTALSKEDQVLTRSS